MGKFMLKYLFWINVIFAMGTANSQSNDIIRLGIGNLCKWSPTGQYLSFTHGNELMIYDVQSRRLDSLAPIFGTKYEWMSDCEILVKQRNVNREKGKTVVDELFLKYFLNGTIDTVFSVTSAKSAYVKYNIRKLNGGRLCISHDGYSAPDSLSSMLGGKSLDSNSYYVISNYDYWQTRHWAQEKDDDIWLIRYDGYPFKRVTTGKTYRMPQLSPDGKKIVCSSGRGMTILDLDGNVLGRFESAEMESWLSDSENLVFTKVVEKDDDIVASDIYITNITGNNEIQITNTPDKVEIRPTVSADKTMVAYISYEIDANYIEIIDIKLQ